MADVNEANVNEQAKTIAELTAMLQEQGQQIAELTAAATNAAKTATTPSAEAAKPSTPKETFKVGKTTYRFVVPQYIALDGKRVLAKDALQAPSELERLVSIGSGVIEAVKA